MEKVNCWLYPYEILATGNNVGIIECCKNIVSIDQLKQKLKDITTLKQFFEFYFGNPNSESKDIFITLIKNTKMHLKTM